MCLYPRQVANPRYKANMKNGGLVPKVLDPRLQTVPIPCGNCMECRKAKATEWRVRLHEEIQHDNTAQFVTLTFNTKSLIELSTTIQEQDKATYGYKLDNQIATLAVKRFRERWRKKYKTSPKHWLVTELGHVNTEHIHLHGFVWTKHKDEIERIWAYGFVWVGDYVGDKTVSYTVKYVMKQDDQHRHFRPIVLCSPGIGKKYLDTTNAHRNRYNGKDTLQHYTTAQGIKLPLPKYYKHKLYNDNQREQLWLDKVESGKRYILGDEIDTTKNDHTFLKALSTARKKNLRLGYGTGSLNPKQKQAEEEYRETLQRKVLETDTAKS